MINRAARGTNDSEPARWEKRPSSCKLRLVSCLVQKRSKYSWKFVRRTKLDRPACKNLNGFERFPEELLPTEREMI